jgi:hypothetical protein
VQWWLSARAAVPAVWALEVLEVQSWLAVLEVAQASLDSHRCRYKTWSDLCCKDHHCHLTDKCRKNLRHPKHSNNIGGKPLPKQPDLSETLTSSRK